MSVYLVARGEGGVPIYRQIHQALISEIRECYAPGDLLPSESELAERFGVHRHTLRRAVDELVADGIVERYHGKGVFVLSPTINYTIGSTTRFTETLESLGHSTNSRVLRKQIILATHGVAGRLCLQEDESLVFIETLREVEGKPFCIISHFLPMHACNEIMQSYESGSLHDFIHLHSGIELTRSESYISAVLPDAEDARLLNMPRHMPILRAKSINRDLLSNDPVEYAITRFRGDVTQLLFQP